MARIRSIKPEFFTSETIASLPLSARLTFIGLWTYVDDNGVGIDNELLITAAIWPLERDNLETLARTREDLARISRAGLVTRYRDSRKGYLHVTAWREHQKVDHPGKPRYPLPDDTAVIDALTSQDANPRETLARVSGTPGETLAPEQGAGSREQGAGIPDGGASAAGEESPKSRRGTRIPADFCISPEMSEWGRERCPHVNGRAETEKFVNHFTAKSGQAATKLDWLATWRNWMLNAEERAPHGAANGAGRNAKYTPGSNPLEPLPGDYSDVKI